VDQERAAGKKICQEFGDIGNARAVSNLSVCSRRSSYGHSDTIGP
jgi:hypothetical protein